MNQLSTQPHGVRLCVDVGSVRIGVAACDRDGVLAFPVETITGSTITSSSTSTPTSSTDTSAGTAQVDAAHTEAGDAPGPVGAANLLQTTALARLVELIEQHQASAVYVGLPLGLRGQEGPAAQIARAFAQVLAHRIAPISVRVVDERLTTVTAAAQLRSAGRKQKKRRPVIDQQAAVVALQAALERERLTGRPAGHEISA